MAEPGSAWARFQASLTIGFDQWHDGIGYDRSALAEMDDGEREQVRAIMAKRIRNGSGGWREVEVAESLGARPPLKVAAKSEDDIVSRRALEALGDSRGVAAKVAAGVPSNDWSVFSQALDPVPDHRMVRVKAGVDRTRETQDDGCVPAGMALLEVFAGVEDAFLERPMFVPDSGGAGRRRGVSGTGPAGCVSMKQGPARRSR